MNVEINTELANRLSEAARQQAMPVAELIERILARFLEAQAEEAALWVQTTQQHLSSVWPAEDFSNWQLPHGC